MLLGQYENGSLTSPKGALARIPGTHWLWLWAKSVEAVGGVVLGLEPYSFEIGLSDASVSCFLTEPGSLFLSPEAGLVGTVVGRDHVQNATFTHLLINNENKLYLNRLILKDYWQARNTCKTESLRGYTESPQPRRSTLGCMYAQGE